MELILEVEWLKPDGYHAVYIPLVRLQRFVSALNLELFEAFQPQAMAVSMKGWLISLVAREGIYDIMTG